MRNPTPRKREKNQACTIQGGGRGVSEPTAIKQNGSFEDIHARSVGVLQDETQH